MAIKSLARTSFPRRKRTQNGSSISEFGPALAILLICIFFPVLDLVAITVSYGCCMLLNSSQVHEASLTKASEAQDPNGPICKKLAQDWMSSGFGRFVKIVGHPHTDVNYRPGNAGDKIVIVDTTVTCDPFLPIPVPFVTAPGLNAPMKFSITSERPMENPDYGN